MRSFPPRIFLIPALLTLAGLLAAHASTGFAQEAEQKPPTAAENADAYRKAAESIRADLDLALAELAVSREAIAAEKPPLAKETNEIAADLRLKRRRATLAEQERDALLHDLNELTNRVRIWRDENTYITTLLEDYDKQFHAQLSLAELNSGAYAGEGAADTEEAHLQTVAAAIARLKSVQGGQVVAGSAIDADGNSRPGRFIEAGPVSWFVADEGGLAGIVTERADLQPEVVPGTGNAANLRNLADGQEASPAFDPTLGTALALGAAEDTLLEHIRKGGFWIYPILLLALVATIAAIAKWVQVMRIRELKPGVVRMVLEAVNKGRFDKAEETLAGLRHPVRPLLLRGIELAGRSRDYVEEALYEKYVEAQPRLQRGLSFIAIASATAPLLGLLGTVTGMIHTFKLINVFGTGDAKSLASGISEALVTTEFGLAVAIPALILHALLSRKVQGILSSMEMASLAFVNGLDVETGEEKPKAPAAPARV